MKLKRLVSRLSRGELSNLSMSGEGSGSIKADKLPSIIEYTNDGLTELFTRFNLSEKSIIIEEIEHITKYHLLAKYAESSGSNEPYHYIKDMMNDPFEEDALKIIAVFDSSGIGRPLNDTKHPASLFTPQPTTLQVPTPVTGQALSVSYQARHPILRFEGDNLLNQDIDIPYYLESALKSFVAYKVYSHMNGQEHKIIAQEHFQTYDGSCRSIENSDLANQTVSTTTDKLAERGFE